MDQSPDASRVRRFVAAARRGTLATLDPRGLPRLVPICFVLDEPVGGSGDPDQRFVLYSAIDEKPKRSADPLRLARVRDILARQTATILVDRWDEEWDRLAWVRLDCQATILPPAEDDPGERRRAIAALRAKYPQYRAQHLESRPLIRLNCQVGAAWGALDADAGRGVSEGEPDVEAM